jgi:monofunctional biosynthetic peptidoglycan transglycosylase
VLTGLRILATSALLALPGCLTLPAIQALSTRFIAPPLTLTMVDAAFDHAVEEAELRLPDAQWVALDALPRDTIPRAAVSSEDGRFYAHNGFDWVGICAAVRSNRRGGRLRGGSTISQQVARNLFLVQHRSWVRKGLESYYTAWLELFVPKDRILELYLNVAETGPVTFGVQAGAVRWFGRDAASLDRDRAGELIALLPNPRNRSPFGRVARKKAGWIRRNPAPMQGDPGFERWIERVDTSIWSVGFPPCAD